MFLEESDRRLEVADQQRGEIHFEASAAHDAHDHHVGGAAGEREGRDLPAVAAQPVGEVVKRVPRICVGLEGEADRRKTPFGCAVVDKIERTQGL